MNMTDSANEDLITTLNTQLNKSMIFMENVADVPSENRRHSKSIKIKTEPSTSSNDSVIKSRKSILKKTDKSVSKQSVDDDDDDAEMNGSISRLINSPKRLSSSSIVSTRPRNLQELVQKEILDTRSISFEYFDPDDISDSEEIWTMDIPRSIDPRELHGQKIKFGDNSKIKIKEERYCAVPRNMNYNVTCVFNIGETNPQYKTVNIKPVGSIKVRRKLSGALKLEPVSSRNSGKPPFPDKLKMRHPVFGVSSDGKITKRLKKHSPLKKKKLM